MKPPSIDALARMSAAELDAYFEMHTVALDGGTYAIRVGGHLVIAESLALLRVNFAGEVFERNKAQADLTKRLVDAVETHVGYTPEASDESPWSNLRECIEDTLRSYGKE